MKITDLRVYHVQPRWCFLKVSTDEGIFGWGEPIVEGRARTVETAVLEHRNFLIGRIPGASSIFDSPFTVIPYIDAQVERFAHIRETVGDEMDIAIDFHGRIDPATATQIILGIEEFRPLFVEEPCLPENTDALAHLASAVHLPIAAGERLVTRHGFRPLLESGAVAVLQPDLCHAGVSWRL